MKFFTKEVKIALVAIVGLVVLFYGLNFLKGLSLFSTENTYYIKFKDVSGLSPSSPLYAGGFKVGVVKEVLFDYDRPEEVKVMVNVDKNLKMPEGTSAEIVSDMLGNVQVNLLFGGNRARMLEPGAVIEGRTNDGALGQVKKMIPSLEKMLPKLDSIMTSLNTLLADPAVAQSLHNVETVTANLTTSTRELNTLMAQLNRDVPAMTQRAGRLMDNANVVAENLTKIDVEQTMRKVNSTLDNVQQFTEQLNSNNGSLGLLMRDPTLYSNLNSTMRSADSLLINMREHPKRYVHFSLFGRKDK
ncbi:MAG: MlaD family protein [Prevotella sp.]|uniref:MlaD family protein n=1 Tax=Prevotella sp. TaxID=59823 RepID=UPI002A27D6EF|nr:MlaD family protein [Prevotella sp.]MDD7317844.1 MlaD family protein [Prevotellaceae bacterium]MDY4020759.1 MlaD family protein [Prevotella sp.]